MNTQNNITVDVLVNGRKVKVHTHEGKSFIEAHEGTEYEILVRNDSWSRILAIASVDGLDVLTGKTAALDAAGYVINGRDQLRIKGFRYDSDTVGAFKFVGKQHSYAAEKGEARNCGVIGVRAFYEYVEPVTPTFYTSSIRWGSNAGGAADLYDPFITPPFKTTTCSLDSATASRSALHDEGPRITRRLTSSYSAAPEAKKGSFDLGSTWGSKKESRVRDVEFKRGLEAASIDIYYASRESLIAMGVQLTTEAQVSLPQSFPNKWATPPKGW